MKISKNKKWLSAFLSLIMVLSTMSMMTVTSFASDVITSGDWKYDVVGDGTARIKAYLGSQTNVSIPSTIDGYSVRGVGDVSFSGCKSIVTITIPDTVTYIENYAFHGCESLTKITLGKSVKNTGYDLFRGDIALANIEVSSDNVYYSSQNGILFNKNKTELICYPTGIKSNSYTIPNTVTVIGNYALRDCNSLTSVTIPDSVTNINDYAFYSCESLKNVVIGKAVKYIGDCAFCNCPITNIVLPDSLISIGDVAFSETLLTSIGLGKAVKNIGEGAFKGCSLLEEINVNINNNYFSSVNGILFNKNKTELLIYPCGKKSESYTIPDSVVSILDEAFSNCALTEIIIPQSVKSIGDDAFDNCDSLKNIDLPNSLTDLGSYAFIGCGSLESVSIPGSVKEIGYATFRGCGLLKKVKIGKGIEAINNYAFHRCYSLQNIILPDTVTNICSGAFEDCYSLKNVFIPNSVVEIEEDFNSCSDDLTVYCYSGSYAETFSSENDITFVFVDDYDCKNGKHLYLDDGYKCFSCDEDGYEDYLCIICGDSYRNIIPAHHDYVNGFCNICLDRDTNYNLPTISLGETKKITNAKDGYMSFVSFVPTENGMIEFYSKGNVDTCGYIYNSDMELLAGSDDTSDNNLNFKIVYNVEKGKEYILACQNYEGDDVFDICLSKYVKNFPDVPSNAWFYEAATYCANKGFINGYGNGNFGATDPLQRQDFVVILANIANADLSGYTTCKLKDVDMNAYYGKAVAWAVDKGIIAGYQNGKFGVGDPINREQVATILYRYMKSPAVSDVDSKLAKFPDKGNISEFAKTPLAWAVENNIISGMQDGTVAPKGTAVRAQIASIIMRMDQNGMFNA